jgi:hypothetical protein
MPKHKKQYHLIVGRVPEDDEDTCFTTEEPCHLREAKKRFRHLLKSWTDDETLRHRRKDYGTDHYINYVAVSDTPITIKETDLL